MTGIDKLQEYSGGTACKLFAIRSMECSYVPGLRKYYVYHMVSEQH